MTSAANDRRTNHDGDQPGNGTAVIDPNLLQSLRWRLIGPFRGGRCVAVTGDPVDPMTFYFGSTGGGVWKSTDGGNYWQNVSDGFFQRASVGAIQVAASDPNIIYVGMGESTIRGNVSHGDGVYKSTDAGTTWQQMGLSATRNIAKIRIHPRNPDLVYVAAFGHAHGPHSERGIYRSRDGGETWEQVLFRDENSGAIDLSMDPNNPRILYAAFWQARRGPHFLSSGGPGSGLFKSTDGGDTWTELTRKPGLPKGLFGKIGIALSPARTGRVWALIEAEKGGLYRSDDSGETWSLVNGESELRQRPWYYMHLFADPQHAETVWVNNLASLKSTDGGKTFTAVPTPHGDNHDLWIDPHNPLRMINGNDGGACVTFNGGLSWSSIYNQPTAEFYHVIADTRQPYRLYGSQQDNSAISIPSLASSGAITYTDAWVPGGGESGYIAVRPDQPDVVFAGSYSGIMTRYDHRTEQIQDITVWPEQNAGWAAKDLKYRFQWTFPIVVSPHRPDHLYATGNHAFRSLDEGNSWQMISPDLTRHEPSTLESSGGPITQDNISTEYYATIFAFAESPVRQGVLWAGSDDGLIHVSQDDGATWQNVTPAALPEWSLISIIEPSPHDPATAYLAANRYKLDDFAPYLYKTTDYGKTWTEITNGVPGDSFARVIREDPIRQGLLYAGTETGVFVSFDDGGHWQSLQNNLPVVPVHDVIVKDGDLVAATHGRSFWILDDVGPLRQLTEAARAKDVHLFTPRRTTRFKVYPGYGNRFPSDAKMYRGAGAYRVTYMQRKDTVGETTEAFVDAGQNPPDGVIVTYTLEEKPDGPVTLTFLDAAGAEIRTFTSRSAEENETADTVSGEQMETGEPAEKGPWLPTQAGANRFVWNLRYPNATHLPGAVFWGGNMEGPQVPPGAYEVRLQVGDETQTQRFEIVKDPRLAATQEDLDAQFSLLKEIWERLSATHAAVNEIRALREQIDSWERRARGQSIERAVTEKGAALKRRLQAVEEELIQTRAHSYEDTLNFPVKLNNKLASLAATVSSADARPTQQSQAAADDLAGRVDVQLRRLKDILDEDVADFDTLIRESSMPALIFSPRADTP
jgi:photosystem II stability/assembly factor-like uncharacterized protein